MDMYHEKLYKRDNVQYVNCTWLARSYAIGPCPVCSEYINSRYTFCPYCGQRVAFRKENRDEIKKE